MDENKRSPFVEFWDSPWFGIGLGMVIGAYGSLLSVKWLIGVGWLLIAIQMFRHDFFQRGVWLRIVLNGIACVVLALILIVLWRFTPKPKEPPTADDIATAVQKKLDEPKRDVQINPSTPSVSTSVKPEPKPKPHFKTNQQPAQKTPENLPQNPTTAQPPPVLSQGHLSLSQSSKVSTRSDAPVETEVVVQTDTTFQSLKFVMQCDGPMIDAQPMIGGAEGFSQMGVSRGIVKDHPNVMVYSYNFSAPPFGPANPLVIDVWSDKPITCNQAATF